MEWVSDLIKDRFDIGNKDNWDPADIWLIRNENFWRKKIYQGYYLWMRIHPVHGQNLFL